MENKIRKIIHVDMDAFYASVEQRDNPEYRGRPVAVGYSGERGVVAAASYEARRFGIRSAMSSRVALKKCPQLIFVETHFDIYKAVSRQIHTIFAEYTDLIEPLSLDEAFLDVTVNHKNIQSATQIAQEIKVRIFEETALTASAGVSYNKFLAKIASDYNKPNGLFVIKPSVAERFVEDLPIERFFGVGKVTAERMHKMGIKTGLNLKQKSKDELIAAFGKMGLAFYQYARAIDEREVESGYIRKSIGAETTFYADLNTVEDLLPELEDVANEVIRRIKKHRFHGRTVTLKIKYADFKTISRSRTYPQPITEIESLSDAGKELLDLVDLSQSIRLIGLSIKNTDDEETVWKYGLQLRIPFENEK